MNTHTHTHMLAANEQFISESLYMKYNQNQIEKGINNNADHFLRKWKKKKKTKKHLNELLKVRCMIYNSANCSSLDYL